MVDEPTKPRSAANAVSPPFSLSPPTLPAPRLGNAEMRSVLRGPPFVPNVRM